MSLSTGLSHAAAGRIALRMPREHDPFGRCDLSGVIVARARTRTRRWDASTSMLGLESRACLLTTLPRRNRYRTRRRCVARYVRLPTDR